MNKLLPVLFFFIFFYTCKVFSQSPLPISWNCEGYLPTGFSMTGVKYYSPSSYTCSSAPSLKFQNNGDQLVMQFAQRPGNIVYFIKSQSNYNGIFRIQESADGNFWTTIKEYRNNTTPTLTNVCFKDSASPTLNSTRYIRFINASSVNVEVDEITVRAPKLTTAEMYVSILNKNIINNGNAPELSTSVNSTFPYLINLRNLSTNATLKIDSIKITGTAKSEYQITNSTPINISANSNTTITVNFTPTTSGSRQAKLIIYSNSTSNPQYTIYLNGVGGSLASLPGTENNPTSIKFYNVKTYRYTVSITTPANKTLDANGGYLVVRTTDSTLNALPQNGVVYPRGSGFGNGKVVFNGSITDSIRFNPTWVHAGKTYYIYIFPYNGSGTTTHYLTSSIISTSITTPPTMMPANEYNGISPTATNFVASLTSLIRPHTSIPYSDYAQTMIDLFENRDTFATFNGYTCERVITCQYSGLNQPYRYPLVWNTYDFSREHTYAHTWMPSYPADNPEKPEYNDQHHLFPTNQTKANAPRCNYPMGEVVSPSYTFLNCKLGLNQNNQKVFEPRNEHKGRVARAIMYMSVAYNTTTTNWGYPNRPPDGTTCSGTPINYKQDEYILKKWNYLYPPTGYEIARNDFLDSIQGNRNPFIDHPEWACYINFTTMTQQTPTDTLCAKMIGYNEISLDLKTHLFPNPATNQITFAILDAFINASLEIYDINGKKIKSKQYEQTTIIEEFINTEHWPKGLYLLHFSSEKGSVIKKFIVE